MRYKILISILFMGLAASRAAAQEPPAPPAPLNMDGKYTVAWNGITIGRIYITAHEDGETYGMLVDTKTSGVAALIKKERRLAEISGHITEGRLIPERFHSRPQEGDKDDYTILTYDPEGQLMNRTRMPDDDPAWRAPVPFTQANEGTDPITGGLVLRRKVHEALAQHQLSVRTKTYDGARFAEIRMDITPEPVEIKALGHKTPAVETMVGRQPIAGYTVKELKKFDAGDPPIRFYFSADERRIPLKVTIDVFAGELTATLDTLN